MFVNDEVGTLEEVGLFGPPGMETYLTQFYPPEVSLCFGQFDVFGAQKEFNGLVGLLGQLGVVVLDMKDAFVQTLGPPSISGAELVSSLVDKVKQSPHSTGEPDVGTLAHLLDLDAKMYGSEDKAIAMNAALSLIPELPLGNIFFARDQANVLFDTCFLSNMKYPIRQPEVAVIKAALEKMGYKKFVQITDGTFEGGDGMVMKGAAYIGSGMRTSPAAVAQIAGCLQDQGKLTYMVTIPDQGGWHENMEVMHLDTFGMPVSQSHYYGCIPVLQQCTTKNMLSGEDETFMAHLMGKGFNICGIPVDEQKNYAANMMGVKPGVVVAPSDYNPETTASLINDGITVHSAKLIHLTQAVGATHCMGLQTQKV